MSATYEIHAIRYATHGRSAKENFLSPADIHDAPMPLDYFVWLLRRGGRTILVDTGFNEAAAESRGRRLFINPADALAAFGAPPETIGDVVITHLHYDHAGNLDRFPNATFHLQDREMAYATGRCMCHGTLRYPFTVDDVTLMVRHVYAGRVTFHAGAAEIAPGVSVHHVGGHSDGLQIVKVATKRGDVVLASDAAHFYANIEERRPFPILVNLADMLEGWRVIERLAGDADRIVPGHDPLVCRRYPRTPHATVEAFALHEEPAIRPRPGRDRA